MAADGMIESLVSLAKRRGFAFPSSEIYGGSGSVWDMGPLGVELKENIKRAWWRSMVHQRDDVVGLDSAVIQPPQVWVASGHVEALADLVTECQACRQRFRADELVEDYESRAGRPPDGGLAGVPCPACGAKTSFTPPLEASRLVRAQLGSPDDDGDAHYLRPETAQGIFVNFLNVLGSARRKPPFGVAQVGRSFRNEATPGRFLFRSPEFEQMELEYFVEPGSEDEWHEYWIKARWDWYVDLGLAEENLRLTEQPRQKLAHYSARTVSIEYRFQVTATGFGELEAIANRTDYDLTTHAAHSGVDLRYFDQERGERWTPYVIGPAAGLTRAVLAFLLDAYDVDTAPSAKGGEDERTVLRLDPRLAPVKAAVLPLSRGPELSPKGRDLAAALRRQWNVEFDDAGAIGRRYRRQDEIGTPYCVTVDFDTLDDGAVTVRERDSMRQERVGIDRLVTYMAERLSGC